MKYADQLKEANTRLSVQMTEIVNKAKAENNRGLTSEEREKFHNLETEYSANEDSIQLAEKADRISADLARIDPDRIAAAAVTQADAGKAAKDAYASAFRNFLAYGMSDITAEEKQLLRSRAVNDQAIKNAAQTLTTSGGGYLIPTDLERTLEVALKFYGGIVGRVGTMETGSGNPLDYPTMNDTSNTGRIIGINTAVTNTALSFGQVVFSSYIFSSDLVLIPLALLQDAAFDVNGLVANALGERLGRLLNNKLTVGSGSSEPNGIVTAAVAAGNTVVASTGGATSVTYNNLVDLEHAVDPLYRVDGEFEFHDSTLKALKKLVDGSNRPLWQPALTASFGSGARPTILDHPYNINNDVPVMAANANSILFGNLKKYIYRKVAGGTTIMTLRERYADLLQVGILGFLRADGQLLDAGTHPVAVFVNSAT